MAHLQEARLPPDIEALRDEVDQAMEDGVARTITMVAVHDIQDLHPRLDAAGDPTRTLALHLGLLPDDEDLQHGARHVDEDDRPVTAATAVGVAAGVAREADQSVETVMEEGDEAWIETLGLSSQVYTTV
jgi:hypothetical protein